MIKIPQYVVLCLNIYCGVSRMSWWGIWMSENNISLFDPKSEIMLQLCPNCEQKLLILRWISGKIIVYRNKISPQVKLFKKELKLFIYLYLGLD